ncbi:HEAT SHOCK PROTEIN 26 [Salix viminalis]|uniref:HEAT SHOCK PROTEIN 26 n=1 Tax=Salix viminalis TaxID=40686 RepID=A0A9Q0Z3K4_SALVM|nr:HEAT SHOCK PROTEIN 26 [Salix viminalis]
MATTDRGDGFTRYTAYPMSRPLELYNYLQPASEWKEEDGALVLLLRIPSVRHEQLGVTVESTNEIKVSGEYTPAGDDRTVRFNAVYGSIPENFSSSELTVDLTLRIRIPKIISAAQTGPTGSQATTSQEAAQETRDEQKGQKNGEYLKEKRWLHPRAYFQEDQVRIIRLPSSHAIQVHAERSLAGNRRSRFNRDFPVPENCDVNKMQARFQAGVFTIEVPKVTTRQPCPEATDKPPIPPNSAVSSSVGEEKGKPDSLEGIEEAASREPSRVRRIVTIPKKTSKPNDASKPIAQKGEDEAP